MTSGYFRIFLGFVFVVALANISWASAVGTISGVVRDPAGAPIAGANVTANHVSSGSASKTKTDDNGSYSFQSLPEGSYELTIELAGAKAAKATGVALQANQKVVANATVEMATLQPEPQQQRPPQQQPQQPMPNMPNMPMPTAGAPPVQQPGPCDSQTNDPKLLYECIKQLEQRINDLESSAVLSEPETRVRRVEVYVDKDGGVHDQPTDGAKRTYTYERERVYRRQTINEKIEDAMSESGKRSVKVGVSAAIIPQLAFQTRGEKTDADKNAYQLANADLYFTANVAQHTLFYADVVGLSGTPPDLEVPSLTLLNGFSARLVRQNAIDLREAWLRTELFKNRIALSAGRLDLTNYFDRNAAANDETSQFLSDALVNNPALGLATNGSGFAAVFDPKIGFTFRVGFQQSNPDATNLSDSLFSLGELGYLARVPAMGEGNYRFWYRVAKAGDRQPTAFGISLDQKLESRITLFGRYGRGNVPGESEASEGGATAFSVGQHYWSGGLQFANGLGFFPGDRWGLGYAHSRVPLGDNKEHLTEGYYSFQLTERLAFSFHVTHVLEKNGETGAKAGFLVPGIRLQANF